MKALDSIKKKLKLNKIEKNEDASSIKSNKSFNKKAKGSENPKAKSSEKTQNSEMKKENKGNKNNSNKPYNKNKNYKNKNNNNNNNNNKKSKGSKKLRKAEDVKGKLQIIPLGGLEEIGKNITLFEYNDEMIIVDAGLAFPDDSMLGVDIVIPDITYLEKNKEKIKGIVITHGHEDHIGGLPYLLKKINVPVYANPLPAELIESKMKEHKLKGSTKIIPKKFGDKVKLGCFEVEFISSTHSIPDASMLAIKTPVGMIVHTGDYKVDFTPVDGKYLDLPRLGEIGAQGVLALMADSTNSERKGYSLSEKSVGVVFDRLFENCTKRIILATFASNVNRMQVLVELAKKYNRKIAVTGRSMEKYLEIARKLKYIDAPDSLFVDLDQVNSIDDHRLLILTTGSQGETLSALTRIAMGEHRKLKLKQNDLVIMASSPIPGNEKSTSKVINEIMKKKVEVIYSALEHVHVSGHAFQEEQKLIISLLRPKFFMPLHGETKHLIAHAKTAMSLGIPKDNIIDLENGKGIALDSNEFEYLEKVESGKVFVDGLGVGDIGNVVLRDRQLLSQDGLIIAVMHIDASTGEFISDPDIVSRGFVYVKESGELLNDLRYITKNTVEKIEVKDWSSVKAIVKSKLSRFIYKKTKREPMILPIIVEV